METTLHLVEELKANGWIKSIPHRGESRTMYYKAFPGHVECECNKGKPKQIEIFHGFFSHAGMTHESFEIECVGQLKNGRWLKLQEYAIEDPTYENLQEVVDELLKLWDYAAQ